MAAPTDALLHPLFVTPRQLDFNPYDPYPGSGRTGWDAPVHVLPRRTCELQHLALTVAIDEPRRSVRGSARLTLRAFPAEGGLREVALDAAELDVTAVRLLAAPRAGARRGARVASAAKPSVAARGKSLTFATEPQHLRVTLDRAYAAGETFTIEVTYSAAPRKGLFFIQPDAQYPQRPWQVWSQGQSEDNHYWFPCLDGPDTKITSEMHVTVAAGRQALSNGTLVKTARDKAAKTVTYHWVQRDPHPSYLVMVTVGDYSVREEKAGTVPLVFYEYKDKPRESKRFFAKTAAMVKHFSTLFGYAYPWEKYGQVLLHDFTFGGMENTSATTMTDRALLDARALTDFDMDGLVAHELGHQWWGDLLTCRSWGEGWLNEGFATYCERLWAEHDGGADATDELAIEERNQYMRQDAKEYRRPLATKRYKLGHDLFDRHLYEKGGMVLHMLRHVLGDEGFFASLKQYAERNAFRHVETYDLEAAVREATGQSLGWFFEQWVRKAGFPELKVTRAWDATRGVLTLTVEQTQELKDETPLFTLPLDIEIETGGRGRAVQTMRLWIEKQSETFHIPLSAAPVRVAIDPAEALLKTLVYDRPTPELTRELARATHLAARVRAARDLATRPGAEAEAALVKALHRDPHHMVRAAAAISLAELAQAAPEGARAKTMKALRGGLADHAGRVRRATLWGLGLVGGEDFEKVCETTIAEDQSYLAISMALLALAHRKTPRAFELISRGLDIAAPMEMVRAATFDALATLRDPRGFDVAYAWVEYGKPVGAREPASKALGVLGKYASREDKDRARERLIALLADPHFRMRVTACRGLTSLGQPAAIDALRAAEKRECLDQTITAMRETAEELERLRSAPAVAETKPA